MWKSRMLLLYAYLSSALLVLVYADKNVGFTLVYSFSILLLLCLAQAASALFTLKASQHIGSTAVFKGESAELSIKIKNRGIFIYSGVLASFHNDEALSYETPGLIRLDPGKETEMLLSVGFPYRGVYKTGIKSLTVVDFLGIFRFTLNVGPEEGLIVSAYPSINEDTGIFIQNTAGNAVLKPDPYNEDYSSLADVRKYRESDNLKKIHWKLTAKRGELIVKDFQSLSRARVNLAIDLRPPEVLGEPLAGVEKTVFEDRMVSYLASASLRCLNAGMDIGVLCGKGKILEMAPPGFPSSLLETLARLDFGEACLPPLTSADPQPGILAAFLSRFDREEYDMFSALAETGLNLFIYYFYSDFIPLGHEQLLGDIAGLGAAVWKSGLNADPGRCVPGCIPPAR